MVRADVPGGRVSSKTALCSPWGTTVEAQGIAEIRYSQIHYIVGFLSFTFVQTARVRSLKIEDTRSSCFSKSLANFSWLKAEKMWTHGCALSFTLTASATRSTGWGRWPWTGGAGRWGKTACRLTLWKYDRKDEKYQRRQDPNNYSDTETRTLSRWGTWRKAQSLSPRILSLSFPISSPAARLLLKSTSVASEVLLGNWSVQSSSMKTKTKTSQGRSGPGMSRSWPAGVWNVQAFFSYWTSLYF